jgi:hypothetical protein
MPSAPAPGPAAAVQDEPPATSVPEDPSLILALAEAAERVQDYAGRSKSEATIKAYAAGWRDFLAFCEQRGAAALPASEQTVAAR